MANEVVNRQVNIYIQSGEAEKALERLTAKEKKLKEELAAATNPKQVEKLKGELAKLAEPIDRAAKKVKGDLQPSMRELQKTVTTLGNRLKHMSEDDADFSKVLHQWAQGETQLRQMRSRMDEVRQAQQGANNGSSSFMGSFFGNLAAQGIEKAASLVQEFFSGAVDEALEAEESTARFAATLSNLGRTDAFDRIMAKADELAGKFKYIDNDEIVGVFNKLIDYGKLTEKQMNDLLPVIIDFAAKQRISITDATSVVVKALEGNGKALKEYGINIKDAETAGDRLNVVMTTLKDKVEGAGEAFMQTAKGGIAEAKQELANTKEEIGTGLIPVINDLLKALNFVLIGAKDIASRVKNTISDVIAFGNGGFAELWANRAKRQAQEQEGINEAAAKDWVSKFADKTSKEIYAEIDRINGLIDQKTKAITSKKGFSKETLEQYTNDVKVLRKELDGLQNLLVNTKGNLGIDPGDDNKDQEKKDKQDKLYNQILADRKKLQEELNKIDVSLIPNDLQRDLAALKARYEEYRRLAHGDKQLLIQVDKEYWKEREKIVVDYSRKEIERLNKLDEQMRKLEQQRLERLARMAVATLPKNVEKIGNMIETDETTKLKLKLMQSSGREQLDAQLQLLDKEEKQELSSTELTEIQKEFIRAQYQKKREDAEEDFWQGRVQRILNFTQQALDIFQTFSDAQTQKENAELERDRKLNDSKKRNLERQLKGKQISQMEYDRKVQEIERDQEKREQQIALRQFRRQQRIQSIQAAINGAQAATKTLAEFGAPLPPNFLGMAAMALTVGTTIAQIAAINNAKPQFARGGKLDGPSHSGGGVQLYSRGGAHFGEAEGGESIINKRTMADRNRYTVSGTPSQITSTLNALHGGVAWESGATLQPVWRSAQPARMNFSAINRTMHQRHFAQGGIVGNKSASGTNDADAMKQTLNLLTSAVVALQAKMDQPFKGYVLLSEQEAQKTRMDAIKRDATMR